MKKTQLTAHLFQTNGGVEFTVASSGGENISFASGDIYKGSWNLIGHEAEAHMTSLLTRVAHAKRPSEQASRLIRLMDISFSRETA